MPTQAGHDANCQRYHATSWACTVSTRNCKYARRTEKSRLRGESAAGCRGAGRADLRQRQRNRSRERNDGHQAVGRFVRRDAARGRWSSFRLPTARWSKAILRPSSDTPTHLALYRAFPAIGGIVHTHSLNATAWAQACREIPALGTTHADYFHGPVPCTRRLADAEIESDYEANTGRGHRRAVRRSRSAVDARRAGRQSRAVYWGKTVDAAVENAVALEYIARMAAEDASHRPRNAADARRVARQTFFPQTRRQRVLRTIKLKRATGFIPALRPQ